ncbi:MAG: hypothetical protein ACLSIL_00935 [Enterococcus casseliflavus]
MALVIEQGNEQELAALESALTAYTKHQKPFTQTETYQSFSCVIKKRGDGDCWWHCLCLDVSHRLS